MLLNRFFYALILLIGISVLNFFLFHLSPGDPTNRYFAPKMNRKHLETKRQQMGVNDPWYQQYYHWGSRVLRGDLGFSWTKHQPVAAVLKEALPATLLLSSAALAINLVLGCALGMMMGIYEHRWIGKTLDILTLAIYAIPVFWLALVFIIIFSLNLQWFPASGIQSLFLIDSGMWSQLGDRLRHLALPASILGLTGAAATSRYIRGNVQNILGQEYIRLAFAKGLSKRIIYFRHVFPNVLLPVITLLGLYFPFLLGGAFIIEVIFAWPGIGRLTYEAVFAKDYPVLMSINFILAIMVIAGNLFSDILYKFVDPRVLAK
jgi:peptide/nickel transport system permease protein